MTDQPKAGSAEQMALTIHHFKLHIKAPPSARWDTQVHYGQQRPILFTLRERDARSLIIWKEKNLYIIYLIYIKKLQIIIYSERVWGPRLECLVVNIVCSQSSRHALTW